MSTIKSSAENLTLNADGANNDVIIQSNGSTKVTVDGQNSRVGIGTASPASVLEISDASSPVLRVTDSNNSNTAFIQADGTNAAYFGTLTNHDVRIAPNNSTKVIIKTDGKMGIGTSSPARTLHVNSTDANVASFEGHQGEGLVISSGTNGRIDIIGYDDGASAYNPIAIRSASGGGIFLDTTGAVTMPSQPAFLVQPSGVQSNIAADASNVTVAFAAERYDQNSDFASNTFTAPVTGKYALNVGLYLTGVDTGATYYSVYISTSNRGYEWIQTGTVFGVNDPTYAFIMLSCLADMDANDTAFIKIVQNAGAAQTDINTASWFSGYLAC